MCGDLCTWAVITQRGDWATFMWEIFPCFYSCPIKNDQDRRVIRSSWTSHVTTARNKDWWLVGGLSLLFPGCGLMARVEAR